MSTHQKIREARLAAKVSQNTLATRIGVTRPTIRSYELGITCPTIDRLAAIARALAVPLDNLLADQPATATNAA